MEADGVTEHKVTYENSGLTATNVVPSDETYANFMIGDIATADAAFAGESSLMVKMVSAPALPTDTAIYTPNNAEPAAMDSTPLKR